MVNFSRKCYTTVKQQFQIEAGYSALVLSAMDCAFVIFHTSGKTISDKLGGSALSICLFGFGACLFLVNVALWLDFWVETDFRLFGTFMLPVVFSFLGLFHSTAEPVSFRPFARNVIVANL